MNSLSVWILITITIATKEVRGECQITYNDEILEGLPLNDGDCYYAVESSRGWSWDDAGAECEGIGGELAEIKDKVTLDAVKDYVAALPTWRANYKQFWLGQTFSYATRQALFKDGSTKTQQQLSAGGMWYAGQPSCSTRKVTLHMMAVFRSPEYLQRSQYNKRFQGLWTTSGTRRRNALCIVSSNLQEGATEDLVPLPPQED